ncbi:MAG: TIGR00730 family Rossman fold protein [Isosphaerales bacterium]
MEKNICVYCGSAVGIHPEYAAAASSLGRALARHGFGLVYGGGRVGLMGMVADAVLEGGGTAIGVIPEPLAVKEVAHDGLTELHVVADMHQRKAMMARRASAFLTLPGGIGTFEEFFETLSWAMLGLHRKPMGILNVAGYFDPLLALLDHAVAAGLARSEHLKLLLVSSDPEAAVSDLMVHALARSPRQPINFEET